MEQVNVAIADDNERMLELLGSIIAEDKSLNLVGKANNGEEVYQIIKTKEPISPALAYSTLKRILKKAGLPSIRFHDLRHTFATMAIENGIDIKTVAALLGHNTVATSINTYTHTTDEMRRAAASNIDRKIGGVEPLNNIRVCEQPTA